MTYFRTLRTKQNTRIFGYQFLYYHIFVPNKEFWMDFNSFWTKLERIMHFHKISTYFHSLCIRPKKMHFFVPISLLSCLRSKCFSIDCYSFSTKLDKVLHFLKLCPFFVHFLQNQTHLLFLFSFLFYHLWGSY